jgi:hypothetical protein
VLTRRGFLKASAAGAVAVSLPAACSPAQRPELPRLIAGVEEVTRRLARHGWRDLLLAASRGGLDISATYLADVLAKPVAVDHSVPGFEDFARTGSARGIEPGSPARSLLYHALASAAVVQGLGDFPTLGEIETVENYVYGAQPPSLAELRSRAGNRRLGIVVFALEYRRAADSVHGRHADLAFSRTGIARMGTTGPKYDAQARAFAPLDPDRPFTFRTVPQRFAAYVAMRVQGADRELYGPRDSVDGDGDRDFWAPVHKLFAGDECIDGLDLEIDFECRLRNEKLKQFHRYLRMEGFPTDWAGADLENFPFVIKDEQIGSLSADPEVPALLLPRPAPFATRARYKNKWLTFQVSPELVADPGVMYFSSVQLLPGGVDTVPTYRYGTDQGVNRPSPEYVNVRHRLTEDGALEDLNNDPALQKIIRSGGYRAQHYIDFSGDGWIQAHCPALEAELGAGHPAFCLVSPPDFFPQVNQRDLNAWWQESVPKEIRSALWAVPPLALSEQRIAADVSLPAGFDLYDDTVTAVVGHRVQSDSAPRPAGAHDPGRYTGLPDASPGIFDPGWDVSQGLVSNDPGAPLQRYLQGYSLGTPFIEDAKLCAALGSYWPAVSPDSTRTFSPRKRAPGFLYPWPTIVPMTDEETGIVPTEPRGFLPWDGVRGPRLTAVDGREVVAYPDIDRVDYIDNIDKLTAYLTSKIDLAETKARVLAMESVYWALGIQDPDFVQKYGTGRRGVIEILKAKSGWAVLSFRTVREGDLDLATAEQEAATQLTGERKYRFHLYRPGRESRDPHDFQRVLLEISDQVVAFSDGAQVVLRHDGGPWQRDSSMPTS